MRSLSTWISVLAVTLVSVGAACGQWSSAMLLNDPSESPAGAIKKPEVCAAAAGGYHLVYRHHLKSGGVPIKYRRFLNASLGPVILAADVPNYAWDQYICEAGNGDLHISWEDWNANPNIGWTRSTNGGLTWAPYIDITNFTNSAKAPRIAPYGAASGAAVICVIWNPANNTMYCNYYNGASWSGATSTGIGCNSQYQVFGICRSPLDGSVYAGGNNGDSTVRLIQYNGAWSSQDVYSPGFFARQSVAVNASGQVMVCWEYNGGWYSRLYTPGSGWGSVQTIDEHGGFGSAIAIPGTNNFYTTYSQRNPPPADTPLRIRGKMWTGAWWGSEEVISGGLPDAQALDSRVAVATDGSMLCCWEWWGNGNAEAWYSVRAGSPPGPSGTLSGVVRDQFGVGVPNVQVSTVAAGTLSGAGGSYSMSVPAGTYTATASTAFYTSQAVNNVVIVQNQTTTINFTITGQGPAPVSSLAVTEGNTSNSLVWQNPSSGSFSGTVVRYSTTAPPATPSQGTLLMDQPALPGSQGQYVHSGLTNGIRVYYTVFAYFAGVSRYYAGGVSANGIPAVRPDFDRDGDVDQTDFGLFQVCLTGSFVPQTNPACQQARLDTDDDDVDQDDLAVLLRCLNGPNTPAVPDCAD